MRQHGAHPITPRAAIVRPLHLLEFVAAHVHFAFDLVELHQAFGEECVVGIEQFEQAAILAQDVVEEQDRLFAQIGRDFRRVVGLQFGQERRDAAAQILRAQPLADERFERNARERGSSSMRST